MITHNYTKREFKFTAAIYATRGAIVEQIRSTDKLFATAISGGFPTAMNYIARNRGTYIEL